MTLETRLSTTQGRDIWRGQLRFGVTPVRRHHRLIGVLEHHVGQLLPQGRRSGSDQQSLAQRLFGPGQVTGTNLQGRDAVGEVSNGSLHRTDDAFAMSPLEVAGEFTDCPDPRKSVHLL